jgi:protoheme IX farnesyltransferase
MEKFMADATATTPRRSGISNRRPTFHTYVLLLKPRVMSLVVFTAAVGLLVAPGQVDPGRAVLSILLIALGGGASGALNMWWDADIDAIMKRTQNRPIPAGRISPRATLIFGLLLSVFSVAALAVVANAMAAALLAFTIFFYVVIYSMWLKRTTPQNIVIGGAAGALPPMIGWAAATGGIAPESLFMFLLIFLWTPPHFWALALFMKEDYARAGVPMLTVTHGHPATRRHIFVYASILALTAILPIVWGSAGPIYALAALILNAQFVYGAWRLRSRTDEAAQADKFAAERRYFRLSLTYLFLHFAAMIADASLRATGWVG